MSQRMTKDLGCAMAALALTAVAAIADTAFTGKDAAHIDWSAKNCEATSTDKEHRLVDEANAKGRDRFVALWMAESGKLVETADTPSKRESLCSDIKGWYGPQGSRISGLITWNSAGPASTTARQYEARGARTCSTSTGLSG